MISSKTQAEKRLFKDFLKMNGAPMTCRTIKWPNRHVIGILKRE